MPEMCGVIVGSTWSPARNVRAPGRGGRSDRRCGPVCARRTTRDPASSSTSPCSTGCVITGTIELPSQRSTRHLSFVSSEGRGRSPPQGVRPPASGCELRSLRRARISAAALRVVRAASRQPHMARLRSSTETSGSGAPRTERSEAEAAVGDHRGAGCLGEARRAAEVIGVRVRDDHGVYVAGLEPGLPQAILDRAPGAGARKPGVDDGGALRVEDRVAVHVPESGHADRELHAQDVRRDFADLRTRGFLFLSACHGGAR